jgi:hypothetical protein
MVSDALMCIENMRGNISANVDPHCDLNSLMIEPQPDCCTSFATANNGYSADPQTSAYNDALKCLQLADCECVNGIASSDTAYSSGQGGVPGLGNGVVCRGNEKYDVYTSLQDECSMHTKHEDCRNSCDQWPHDGAEPIERPSSTPPLADCSLCWDFDSRSSIYRAPSYMIDKDGCEAGSLQHTRWKTYEYDWWRCWFDHDCVNPLSTNGGQSYTPPVRDGVPAWGQECTSAEWAEFDGGDADFDCLVGGVPQFCDATVTVSDEGIANIPGIYVPGSLNLMKYEDIDCKIDIFACEPTVSAANGRLGMSLFVGIMWMCLVGVLMS